ncbi:hypothetical protein Mettu_0933 [Methylobacter tundripaludum SV96]|uniref:Uncharacterized protein n=1 Tax=Methylobacter tundripaludum (strain ATCC BAA-1195 / DSM 17260 / SV96) TaxID=697282 RepID=G3IRC1_METTV|nr:hypothetical protein Mettu_0933 [Methylobacter tundripaludum SV96]
MHQVLGYPHNQSGCVPVTVFNARALFCVLSLLPRERILVAPGKHTGFKKSPPKRARLWLYNCTGLFWEPVDSRHSVAVLKNARYVSRAEGRLLGKSVFEPLYFLQGS